MGGVDLNPKYRKQDLLLPGQWDKSLTSVDNAGKFLLPQGTHWIEADVLNITRAIKNRWPELGVASCACGKCAMRGHFPHMVVQLSLKGKTIPVFGFSEFSPEIIRHLEALDFRRHDKGARGLAEELIKQDEAKRLSRKNSLQDEREEHKDMIVGALRSRKHDYSTPLGKCDSTRRSK